MGYLDNKGLEHYSWLVRNKLAKNQQMTKSAPVVQFCPAPETELEPIVDFVFTETPPAEGEKGPENPSTITGVSSAKVTRCGKNVCSTNNLSTATPSLFTLNTATGGIKVSGTTSSSGGAIEFRSVPNSQNAFVGGMLQRGKTYTFSHTGNGPTNSYPYFRLYIKDTASSSWGVARVDVSNGSSVTYTIPSTAYACLVRIDLDFNATYDCECFVQIEEGTTATSFEPYAGTDYTIQLGDTYYGGSLDVATGVMTVTYTAFRIGDYQNSITYHSGGDRWEFFVTPRADYSVYPVCTHAIFNEGSAYAEATDGYFRWTAGGPGTWFWFKCSATTLSDFMDIYADAYVAYKLYKPQTVQLTPQKILSLPQSDPYVSQINTVYSDQQSVKVGWIREDIAPTVWVKDMLRAEIEAVSGGRNTVVRDQWDNPHTMVVVPKFRLSDIDSNWSTDVHPAFIVNGTEKSEILIGKYLASKSSANRVLTLPRQAPWTQITFDSALAECRALGAGFCLNTNVMWSARVLWDYKTLGGSHEYLGNRNFGRDSTYHELTGTLKNGSYTPGDTSLQDAATLTGTGGEKWTDDETAWGIADLVGNVWEWTAGLRLVDGEIQILPNNDASLAAADLSATSTEWKAILEDGTLVASGTANTLKYDGDAADTKTNWADAGSFSLNDALTNQNVNGYYSIDFKNLAAVSGVTVPAILKQLALFPVGNDVQGHMWICNKSERLVYRGGGWRNDAQAGPFALNIYDARSNSYSRLGFRAAFVV